MDLNLYERELIAIDGSKFRAVNGRKKIYNEEILKSFCTLMIILQLFARAG